MSGPETLNFSLSEGAITLTWLETLQNSECMETTSLLQLIRNNSYKRPEVPLLLQSTSVLGDRDHAINFDKPLVANALIAACAAIPCFLRLAMPNSRR